MSRFFTGMATKAVLWSEKSWPCRLGLHKWSWHFDDVLTDSWDFGRMCLQPCQRCIESRWIRTDIVVNIEVHNNIKRFLAPKTEEEEVVSKEKTGPRKRVPCKVCGKLTSYKPYMKNDFDEWVYPSKCKEHQPKYYAADAAPSNPKENEK